MDIYSKLHSKNCILYDLRVSFAAWIHNIVAINVLNLYIIATYSAFVIAALNVLPKMVDPTIKIDNDCRSTKNQTTGIETVSFLFHFLR